MELAANTPNFMAEMGDYRTDSLVELKSVMGSEERDGYLDCSRALAYPRERGERQ